MKSFDDATYLKKQEPGISQGEKIETVPVEKIRPNRYQPRTVFQKEALKELSASIAEKGVLQPITLRPIPIEEQDETGSIFEIVYGERRWRASQMAGLTHIPSIIRNMTVRDLMVIAAIENDQREDLAFFDRMNSYAMLKGELGNTEEVAKQVNKSRRTIERYIKIHSDITAVKELYEVTVQQKESLEFKAAEILASKASFIDKLRKSNKREFDRIIDRLSRKGINESRDWLEKKFSKEKKSQNNEGSLGYLNESEESVSLKIEIEKTATFTNDQLNLMRESCLKFIGILESLINATEPATEISGEE